MSAAQQSAQRFSLAAVVWSEVEGVEGEIDPDDLAWSVFNAIPASAYEDVFLPLVKREVDRLLSDRRRRRMGHQSRSAGKTVKARVEREQRSTQAALQAYVKVNGKHIRLGLCGAREMAILIRDMEFLHSEVGHRLDQYRRLEEERAKAGVERLSDLSSVTVSKALWG